MTRKTIPLGVFLGVTVFFSLFVHAAVLAPQVGISSSGAINYGAPADITVYLNFEVLGTSNYHGTTHINGWCWSYIGDPAYRQTLIDGGFHAMREYSLMGFQPCTSWDGTSGTWNWQTFDGWLNLVVNTMKADPIITIDTLDSGVGGGNGYFPSNAVSFGHYIADFVQHVYEVSPAANKQLYYDLINEAWMYATGNTGNVQIINGWFTAMKTAEADYPNLLTAGKFSSDCFKGGTRSGFVFEELLDDNWRNTYTPSVTSEDIKKYVGWLSYHTTSGEPTTSDDIFIRNAEYDHKTGFDGLHYEWGSTEGLSDLEKAQQWKNKFGNTIPIFGSETKPITDVDHRNVLITTAVWRAEMTRARILQGIVGGFVDLGDNDYSWKGNSGNINDTGAGYYVLIYPNYQKTWRYYTHVIINNNLSPGDTVYDAWTSDFKNLSALAWSHNGELKLLLVNKVERYGPSETLNIKLDIPNLSGYTAKLLDPSDSQDVTASITETSGTLSIALDGYAVALLTLSISGNP